MFLSSDEQLALVKRHAPILWLHEQEVFLPVDAARMVEVAHLYRNGSPPRRVSWDRTLDALGNIPKSKDTFLKIPDLDLREFKVDPADRDRLQLMGPEAVKHLARERYGHDIMNGIPNRGPNRPKYYARVSQVDIKHHGNDPFTAFYRHRDPGIFGPYVLVEYFFFFVYNDAWNQHQGDWDCQVELYIHLLEDRAYMVNHLHNVRWASKLWPLSRHSEIAPWLKRWQNVTRGQLGDARWINEHPYVFLTQGAHAGYPTPGYTLHGFNIPGIISRDDLLSNTDQRHIGRGCIIPEGVSEDNVRFDLTHSGLSTNKLVFGRWSEPEIIDAERPVQPWLRFRGAWGEETFYKGWDGPKRPPITRKPENKLKKAILAGYESGSALKNFHIA